MRLRPNLKTALAVVASVAVVTGVLLAFGAPRLTIVNTGVLVSYPLRQGLWAMLAAAGAFALVALLPARPTQLAAAGVGALALFIAADRLGYRLEATRDAFVCRRFGWATRLPWRDVAEVTVGLDGTRIVSGQKHIALDTAGLPPDDAAIINRTVARRVSEASRQRAE